jgi:hypothetical protein
VASGSRPGHPEAMREAMAVLMEGTRAGKVASSVGMVCFRLGCLEVCDVSGDSIWVCTKWVMIALALCETKR